VATAVRRGIVPVGLVLLTTLAGGCGAPDDVNVRSAVLSEDGRTVTLAVPACARVRSADVTETGDDVEVAAQVADRVEGDCAGTVVVHLREPLGDRPLIDGTTQLTIDVRRR
jgi:hypothetical protein